MTRCLCAGTLSAWFGLLAALGGCTASPRGGQRSADSPAPPVVDFFAGTVSDHGWAERVPPERARDALDWRRRRRDALEPLMAGSAASWHALDFAAGTTPDGSYQLQVNPTRCAPKPVLLLDGAYSSRPELNDLITMSVLVEAPPAVREERLTSREAPDVLAAWHARWDTAEDYYFTTVRPPDAFTLRLSGS
jgi:uridine kinase